jgi:hypothetical protein
MVGNYDWSKKRVKNVFKGENSKTVEMAYAIVIGVS